TPIACDGVILCPLPDMLVAVLQGTGEVLWCWYDKKSSPAKAVSGAGGLRDLLDSVVNMPGGIGRVWLGVTRRRIVYSSPSVPNKLLCIAPDCGRVVWEKTFSDLSFVVLSTNELVIVAGNTLIQLNPTDGQVMATATIPKNRFAAGDGTINEGTLYLPLDDGSIAKVALATVPGTTLSIETISSGLPEGGNLVAHRNGILLATPEWLAACCKQGNESKSNSDTIRPANEVSVLSPIKPDHPDKVCPWSNNKRFEFEAKPRVGKNPLPSDLSVFVRPKGRELALSGKQCDCLKSIRFYLSDDETRLMIFDEFNKLVSQIPFDSTLEGPLRKTSELQSPCDIDPQHRFVLTDEGVFLICDRMSKDRFVVRFAQHDRYVRSKDRDVRTIHSERRGLEAEWNAWYRELGLDVCVVGPFVAWFDSHGMITTINLHTGKLCRMGDAGPNAKFVRMFASGEKLFALVLEFQSRLGANGKRQSVRQWRLEQRSLDDGHTVASAPLPYTPVFQTGAILLVQSSVDSKFKQIEPAVYLESYREKSLPVDSKKSGKDNARKSNTTDGTRDLAIANDTVFRLVRNENLALLRLQDQKLIALDTQDGTTVFQTTGDMKTLDGRPVDYELWRDGTDVLILYRLGGLFPEPGDSAGPLAGLASKPVARGQIMRYAANGKELWPEYITVERTFLFDRQLDRLPCLLLGKSDSGEDSSPWRAVMAIDKRSGAYLFRAKIPVPTPNANGEVPLQGTFFVDQAKGALCIALDAEYRFYFKTQEQTETNHDKR
ncbi:MAG: hypothetical protein Q4G59_07720, partial [Planctomycetia bacterium]|nr:hypothetical protein [Planctomycetia bacterium]